MTSGSKYQQIVRSLAEKIRRGVYPPGGKLPGYVTLAREYNVSSITSNRALSELERMGLVERRERFGTFVTDRPRLISEIFVVVDQPLVEENIQYFDYWRGVANRAEQIGIPVQTILSSDPGFTIRTSLDRNVGQGFIFLGFVREYPAITAEKNGIPCLYLGVKLASRYFCVVENRFQATCALVRTMIEDGHRKIGFIGNLSASNHRLARDGYLAGIEPLGLGYRYIRDGNEANVADIAADLLADDLALDAIIIMGGHLPSAALPVILNSPRKPAMGVLTEGSSILQLNNVAYIASYSQLDAGKMAFDLLLEISAGRITSPITRYLPFRIYRPGEKIQSSL